MGATVQWSAWWGYMIPAILWGILICLAIAATTLGYQCIAILKANKYFGLAATEFNKAAYSYSLASGKHAEEYFEDGDYHAGLGMIWQKIGHKWQARAR